MEYRLYKWRNYRRRPEEGAYHILTIGTGDTSSDSDSEWFLYILIIFLILKLFCILTIFFLILFKFIFFVYILCAYNNIFTHLCWNEWINVYTKYLHYLHIWNVVHIMSATVTMYYYFYCVLFESLYTNTDCHTSTATVELATGRREINGEI